MPPTSKLPVGFKKLVGQKLPIMEEKNGAGIELTEYNKTSSALDLNEEPPDIVTQKRLLLDVT